MCKGRNQPAIHQGHQGNNFRLCKRKCIKKKHYNHRQPPPKGSPCSCLAMKNRKNLLAGNCRKNKMVLGLKWPFENSTFKNLKPQFLILQCFSKNKLKLFASMFLAFSKNFCMYCQAISPCKTDFEVKLSFAGREARWLRSSICLSKMTDSAFARKQGWA